MLRSNVSNGEMPGTTFSKRKFTLVSYGAIVPNQISLSGRG